MTSRAVLLLLQKSLKMLPFKRVSKSEERVENNSENLEVIAQERAKWKKNSPHLNAPQKIIDCVEQAVLLDYAGGMNFEQKTFQG